MKIGDKVVCKKDLSLLDIGSGLFPSIPTDQTKRNFIYKVFCWIMKRTISRSYFRKGDTYEITYVDYDEILIPSRAVNGSESFNWNFKVEYSKDDNSNGINLADRKTLILFF